MILRVMQDFSIHRTILGRALQEALIASVVSTTTHTIGMQTLGGPPHPVIVTIRETSIYIKVLLYSYYATITGWGVHLMQTPKPVLLNRKLQPRSPKNPEPPALSPTPGPQAQTKLSPKPQKHMVVSQNKGTPI